MKIDSTGGPSGPKSVSRAKKSEKGKSSAFAKELAGETEAPSSVAAPVAAGPIDALLALQEVDSAGEERRQARKYGNKILDRLDEIRNGLLTGAVSRRSLNELSRTLQHERARVSDPRLIEILDEIDLRAAVELAKFDAADNADKAAG